MCEEAVYDVVALGELLIDFTPVSTDGAGCPTLKANPGGAPGNLLAALSRYGRRTAFLGKVGEDAFGRLLLESLRRAGVQTRGIRLTSSAFTTLAFVTLDAAGDRSFSFARKPGADTQLRWEEVDRSLIQRCRLFHFGSLSLTDEPARSATRAAVAYARELGRTVTFDPNLRLPLWPSPAEARAQILWSLCQADVVKLSDEEVDFLWGCSPQEGARRLLEENAALKSRLIETEQARFAALAEEDPLYQETPNAKQADYIRRLVRGVADHAPELDGYIAKYAKGWNFARIPLVASAIMRVAMYEILYMPDIPHGASINEAVEIAKKYETPETVKFINGILGTFVRRETAE